MLRIQWEVLKTCSKVKINQTSVYFSGVSFCAHATTMDVQHEQSQVSYKLVDVAQPARLTVLMRCLNHVVHWEHGARESTQPEKLLQQGGRAWSCSLHCGFICLHHWGTGHHWKLSGYVCLLQVGIKLACLFRFLFLIIVHIPFFVDNLSFYSVQDVMISRMNSIILYSLFLYLYLWSKTIKVKGFWQCIKQVSDYK